MKTLIIYYSKCGCTKKISNYIAKNIAECDCLDIKSVKPDDLMKYDFFIIGSSLHAGGINSKIKKLLENMHNFFAFKKIAFFIVGMDEQNLEKRFEENYPETLRNKSVANGMFKGEIALLKLNFIERFIIKKIMKTEHDILKKGFSDVDKFIDKINQKK